MLSEKGLEVVISLCCDRGGLANQFLYRGHLFAHHGSAQSFEKKDTMILLVIIGAFVRLCVSVS